MKTAAALILALAFVLVACGGSGGDDSAPATVVLVDQVVTKTPAAPSQPSAWVFQVDSPAYTLTAAAGTVEVCAEVTWTQTMLQASALTLRTTMKGAGAEVQAVSATSPGAVGANVLTFKRCGYFDSTGASTRSNALQFDLRTANPGVSGYLGDYAVSVRWVVTAPR